MENEKEYNVNRLVEFIENPVNVAEFLEEDELIKIGHDVVSGFDADLDSMNDWVDIVNKGFELIKPEVHPKSDPWPGAANYKSPVIIDAALKFGDRATSELLRGDELIKCKIYGKDKDGLKKKRLERVLEYMNWQVVNKMPEWIKEQSKLMYDLPYTGCLYKKTYFSSEKQRNVSELIAYPAFAVNHNADSMERLRRFTHVLEFPMNEVIERQRGGIWLDVPLSMSETDEENESQAESDKISIYLEQQTWLDLDEDGYEEPYTVMVHKGSSKVLRIVPRYNYEDVLLKDEKNQTSIKLSDAINELVDYANMEVIKITPNSNVTKYGFIHNPDGGLLDVGYFHLLAGVNGAINVTTNQLINAGNLANLQGGWTAKGMREKLGNMRIKPGSYQQTNLNAQDLQTGIRDYNFKEPSPTLFQLNQFMLQMAEKTSASADLTGALGANAPATTTLALVQEQQQSSGAIMMRIYRAMSEEFKMLYKLNSLYLDEEEYKRVVDDPEASKEDFNLEDFDLCPTANPEVSSKIQRIQLAQAELSQIQTVAAAGGNIQPIIKNFYEALGTQYVDDIFPELTKEQIAAQEEEQKQAMQEQQLLQEIAVDMQERKQANEDAKTAADVQESQAKTIKYLEEAETEQTKNLSDVYTRSMDLDRQALELQQLKQQQGDLNSGINQGAPRSMAQ